MDLSLPGGVEKAVEVVEEGIEEEGAKEVEEVEELLVAVGKEVEGSGLLATTPIAVCCAPIECVSISKASCSLVN